MPISPIFSCQVTYYVYAEISAYLKKLLKSYTNQALWVYVHKSQCISRYIDDEQTRFF